MPLVTCTVCDQEIPLDREGSAYCSDACVKVMREEQEMAREAEKFCARQGKWEGW